MAMGSPANQQNSGSWFKVTVTKPAWVRSMGKVNSLGPMTEPNYQTGLFTITFAKDMFSI